MISRLTPNQSAAANRRPAGQSDGSGNLLAAVAADRALPAAVAELGRSAVPRFRATPPRKSPIPWGTLAAPKREVSGAPQRAQREASGVLPLPVVAGRSRQRERG
jgi:hypothetical protein